MVYEGDHLTLLNVYRAFEKVCQVYCDPMVLLSEVYGFICTVR